jgi:hypothetical protein
MQTTEKLGWQRWAVQPANFHYAPRSPLRHESCSIEIHRLPERQLEGYRDLIRGKQADIIRNEGPHALSIGL